MDKLIVDGHGEFLGKVCVCGGGGGGGGKRGGVSLYASLHDGIELIPGAS